MEEMSYCNYFGQLSLDKEYHDAEWGHPLHDDDRRMFEYLTLEVMQCGLSWSICLKRRDVIAECFENYDMERISAYTDTDVARIMHTEGMIRSERKIRAVIRNAAVALQIVAETGSLTDFFWNFTEGCIMVYEGHADGRIPVFNGLSKRVADDLRKRGMTYVGPVNMYAHLQSCGIINDHSCNCPTYAEVMAGHAVNFSAPDEEKLPG